MTTPCGSKVSYRGFKTRGEAAALATHTLNVFGEMCPGPLLKAEARVREMAPGDTLVMESDHSCTVRLLREHLRRLPCRFRVEEVGFGVWRLTIERR